MTLILAVTCPGYSVLVADRRITSGRRVVDEEQDKIVTVAANNGRGVMAFTGLARGGGLSVHDWLIDSAHESLKAHGDLGRMVDDLRSASDELYRQLPPYARKESLSIVGVGVSYVTGTPRPLFFVVTNDRSQAIVQWTDVEEGGFGQVVGVNESPRWEDAFMLAYGWTKAVSTPELVAIQDLARSAKPPEAVRDKAIELIQEASIRVESQDRVGGQCGSAIVPVDPGTQIEASYSVVRSSNVVHMVAHVTPQLAVKGGWIRRDDGEPMIYPRVARNAPCPCGSRIRYRHCHGRTAIRPRRQTRRQVRDT